MDHIQRLKARLAEVHHLHRAAALLSWDQATYMPPGGAAARAEQLATLQSVAHRIFTDGETERLLDAAAREVDTADRPPDDDAASLVRVTRRDYTQATCLPADLVEEMARASTLGYEAWVAARSANDFAAFAPWLRKNVDLARRQAGYLGYEAHPYDALLDQYEPGMTVARLRPLFDSLREGIVPVVQQIAARAGAVTDDVLHRRYDESTQMQVARDVARDLGYDFSRGRLDLTVHPFAISFSPNDVRITTRFSADYLQMGLMGTMHEAGHGLYEQNIALELDGTPLAAAASLGLHESQSRLWENVVGRSSACWRYLFPLVQRAFPDQLGDVSEEILYRAFNKVSPSLIRVEADEVTYNLHIMLRFDLETALLEERLAIEDIPEAWNAAMQEYLGITPPSDVEGVLQDMHWSGGLIGYFPTYTLGNVLAVQIYQAALTAIPSIPDEIAQGHFTPLLGWLRDNVLRHGRKYDPDDLIERATGQPLTVEPYLHYLRDKFGRLYGLS